MDQPNTPSRDVTTPQATITGAKTAPVGTIMASVIGAAAAITVALVQPSNVVPTSVAPGPVSRAADANSPAASSSPLLSTRAATNSAPATSDGVTYQCTGVAPPESKSPTGQEDSREATSLPLSAHDDNISQTVDNYSINVALKGSGDVTCTVSVTDAGHTTTNSSKARGTYSEARPDICANYQRQWNACKLNRNLRVNSPIAGDSR